jgi:hypothetical protein
VRGVSRVDSGCRSGVGRVLTDRSVLTGGGGDAAGAGGRGGGAGSLRLRGRLQEALRRLGVGLAANPSVTAPDLLRYYIHYI